MKIAVVGSGISGISVARMLSKEHEIVVYEQNSEIGGLIKCERLNEGLFHKVGGHVFNSKNPEVLDWFWSHFDREHEFVQVKRNAKVWYDNRLLGYPIENHLYMLDKELTSTIVQEMMTLMQTDIKSPYDYPNFESFLRGNFGDTLFEIYFHPYNRKIWQVDLRTVSMEWLEGKLPMPNLREVLLSNILRTEERSMVHAVFFYPKNGGSQFIVNRLAQGLLIKTNVSVSEIQINHGKFLLKDGACYDKVIYTGDIRNLPEAGKSLLMDQGINPAELSTLRSNGTSNLFCQTDENDLSWLYIPQDFTKAHRIIYTGNFTESNNQTNSRKTCVVEFSGKVSPQVMEEEVKKLPGNLTPLSYNYEPSSYIVHDHHSRGLMQKVKTALEKHGIVLLGRFAEWEYYNMDKCIESSFAVVRNLQSKNGVN